MPAVRRTVSAGPWEEPCRHGGGLGRLLFPFRDGLDALALAGATAVVQPGVSERDAASSGIDVEGMNLPRFRRRAARPLEDYLWALRPHQWIKERREFKLWSTATPARMPGASERAARFWTRMAPHFDYRADDVGVVDDDGLAQVFVRRCDPERLRDRKFAFAWVSGDSGQPASAWYPWENPRRNRLGRCVTVFEPPNGTVRIMALSAHDYTARLLGDARLLIRSDFDVYRNENQLVYVRDHCSAEDVERRFFVHVWPADPGDLSEGGQRHGFDNLDFDFQRGGMRTGGRCIAVRALPSYDIAHIRTVARGEALIGLRQEMNTAKLVS